MKLIKLSSDHYIIVDDSKIKEGDWHLKNDKLITRSHIIDETCKKITHSTRVEIENYWNVIEIPLSEVRELIGQVDMEKKLSEVFKKHGHSFEIAIPEFKKDLILLYNQCLEDNKDRKYTEDDIRAVYQYVQTGTLSISLLGKLKRPMLDVESYIKLVDRLNSRVEWDVEFIDGKLKLKQ